MLQPSPLFSQSRVHTRPCQGGQDFLLTEPSPQAIPALPLCHKLGSSPCSEMASGEVPREKGLGVTGKESPPAWPNGAGDAASSFREKKKLSWDITFQLNREMAVKHLRYYLYYLENKKKGGFLLFPSQ